MYSWLLWTSFLYLLIVSSVFILEIIAFWKMFEKAGEHGRYILIPWFNLFVLSRIARRTELFWYMIWWLVVGILCASLGLKILFILVDLFTIVICWILNYSIAKNFWRTNSAALVFVVSPINYLALWFSDDQYIYKDNKLIINRSVKRSIDENILRDIENEIHTKHLWENTNTNTSDNNYWNNNCIWNSNIQNPQNFQTPQNFQNPQNTNIYQNNWMNKDVISWNTPSIYN